MLSVTVYGTGVGSPVNPASGVNVTVPSGLACHVPSPGTTKLSLSPSPSVSVAVGSVKFTVLTFKSSSGSVSFPTTSTVVGVPVTPPCVSSTAVGAVCG